jgi:hypothetical protein
MHPCHARNAIQSRRTHLPILLLDHPRHTINQRTRSERVSTLQAVSSLEEASRANHSSTNKQHQENSRYDIHQVE